MQETDLDDRQVPTNPTPTTPSQTDLESPESSPSSRLTMYNNSSGAVDVPGTLCQQSGIEVLGKRARPSASVVFGESDEEEAPHSVRQGTDDTPHTTGERDLDSTVPCNPKFIPLHPNTRKFNTPVFETESTELGKGTSHSSAWHAGQWDSDDEGEARTRIHSKHFKCIADTNLAPNTDTEEMNLDSPPPRRPITPPGYTIRSFAPIQIQHDSFRAPWSPFAVPNATPPASTPPASSSTSGQLVASWRAEDRPVSGSSSIFKLTPDPFGGWAIPHTNSSSYPTRIWPSTSSKPSFGGVAQIKTQSQADFDRDMDLALALSVSSYNAETLPLAQAHHAALPALPEKNEPSTGNLKLQLGTFQLARCVELGIVPSFENGHIQDLLGETYGANRENGDNRGWVEGAGWQRWGNHLRLNELNSGGTSFCGQYGGGENQVNLLNTLLTFLALSRINDLDKSEANTKLLGIARKNAEVVLATINPNDLFDLDSIMDRNFSILLIEEKCRIWCRRLGEELGLWEDAKKRQVVKEGEGLMRGEEEVEDVEQREKMEMWNDGFDICDTDYEDDSDDGRESGGESGTECSQKRGGDEKVEMAGAVINDEEGQFVFVEKEEVSE